MASALPMLEFIMKLFLPSCLQYVGILTVSRISNALALEGVPREVAFSGRVWYNKKTLNTCGARCAPYGRAGAIERGVSMNNEEKILGLLVTIQDKLDSMEKTQKEEILPRLDSLERTQQKDILPRLASLEQTQQEEILPGLELLKEAARIQEEEVLPSLELLKEAALTQENTVLPRLELLGEGQAALHHKLEELAPVSRVEALEDDMAVVKDVTRIMRREIAELKQAQ